MKLNALLVSRDQESLRVLTAALDELQIESRICHSSAEAAELLVQGRYSALVTDFALPGATRVTRMASIASPERRPALFAMVDDATARDNGFQAGINFVLHKPISLEQVMRPLRAWQIFTGDRRRAPRRKLEAVVYLQFGVAALPALLLDLSEQGLALQAAEPLPPVQNVPLRFVLPGTTQMVEATGEVIWADDLGRAGMVFAQLTPAARSCLKNWLDSRRPSHKDAERVPLSAQGARHAALVSS